jgi:prephenate dehydrogenase
LKVAIIGSSGGMGSFFVRYFLNRGFTVYGSDPRKTRISSRNFKYYSSNTRAVKHSDITVVAAPIDRTIEVTKGIAEHVKPGSVLMEISSIKGRILPELKKIVQNRVKLLSVHPLFGPSIGSARNMKIAVVGIKNKIEELRLAKNIFPDVDTFVIEEKDHDRLMALVLSLTHLVNLVYAKTLSKYTELAEFRKISTPNSLLQLTLAEGVLSQSPTLYSYIQFENPHSQNVIESLCDEMMKILSMIRKRDREAFERLFSEQSEFYRDDSFKNEVMKKIYKSLEVIGDG